MAKAQKAYVCGDCGASTTKWQGQCPACAAWNSLEPRIVEAGRPIVSLPEVSVQRLADVGGETVPRIHTGLSELDRALGGGLVAGSAVLIDEADPRLRPLDPELLKNVSRSAPCPCGSGKKFKHCHGSF